MKKLNGKSVDVREMVLEDLAAVYALGEAVFTADKWPSLYRTWDEYEPVSLYEQEAYKQSMANEISQLPATGYLCRSVISLPMHTELDEETLEHISEGVKAFFK